jgi:acyl-CoA thioesterase-2
MSFGFDSLLTCFADGSNLDIGYHRVFGGQILGQALLAAAAASPDKSVKSMHVLFPREGDAGQPLDYDVTPLQSGRTFGTTEVIVRQGEKVVSAALVSVHAAEDGPLRTDPMPAVGTPDDAAPQDLAMIPWETRVVGDVDLADRAVGPPEFLWWMRTPPVDGGVELHQALLAHATDLTLIGTALRPLDGVSQADSTVTLHTAVTSHTLWFHQPFRVDDWLLIAQQGPVVAKGRAFGRGDVFDPSSGALVASFAQESMVRPIPAS